MARTTKRAMEQTEKREPIPQTHAASEYSHEAAIRERLQAVRFLLEAGVVRIEQIIQRGELLTADRLSLQLETDDTRDYFLEKLTDIRASLHRMAEELNLPTAFPKNKQILELELLALTILVQRARPTHISEGDGDFDREVREILSNTIEKVVLDLLNLRARVK